MIVYAINNYVWALLQKKLDWTPISSKQLAPFFPAQQQPEAMNQTEPFIIYMSSNEFNDGDAEYKDSEIISYLIYSGSEDKENDIDRAVTLIKNAMKSFNSAENINLWIHNPLNVDIAEEDKESIVTYTQVMDTESSGVTSSEGGKVDGYISFRVGYHTKPDDYSI